MLTQEEYSGKAMRTCKFLPFFQGLCGLVRASILRLIFILHLFTFYHVSDLFCYYFFSHPEQKRIHKLNDMLFFCSKLGPQPMVL